MIAPLLIIGRTGQLAQALAKLEPTAITLSRDELDLAWAPSRLADTLSSLLEEHAPRGVINAAAYTQVDRAENDRELAFQINGRAPGVIAGLCADQTIPLVHISTDYVFGGESDQPRREDDPTQPINVYGESKLAGEAVVQGADGQAAILRTSWVYDGQGANFATTMLRLAQTRDRIRVVDDQIGRPTSAADLAQAARAALGQKGVFHVSGTGAPVSWAGFAKAIFETAGLDITVDPIASAEFPTDAARPAYSVLDTSRFERDVAALPDWTDGLRRALTRTG